MTEFIDRAGLLEATEFIRRKLTAFDLSKLDKLTLKAGLRSNPLSWRVKKPVRAAKGSRNFKSQFEVTASVIGSKYRSEEKEPVRVPVIAAKELNAPPELMILLHLRAEMLVFAAAAGLYHFLRRTKQVPGVAANWMAKRYAYGWVAEFAPKCQRLRGKREYENRGSFYTCFGVELPKALIDPESSTYFGYAAHPYQYREMSEDAVVDIVANQRIAVSKTMDRTFGDCDPLLVEEIKQAHATRTPWLILADWLEERGDRRSIWIRSHRLDLVDGFGHLVQSMHPADRFILWRISH